MSGSARQAKGVTAVLVDYGGVLTTSLHDAFEELSAGLGLDATAVGEAFARDASLQQALTAHEKGEMGDAGFEEALGRALSGVAGRDIAPEGLLRRIGETLRLEESMVALVHRLRREEVPVALVSNSLGEDCYRLIDRDALFDVSVISAEVGVRKPSRRIYQIACERLGVDPANCVLVDDLQQNLDGAARLGITGVLHRRPAETVAALESLLELSPGAGAPDGDRE